MARRESDVRFGIEEGTVERGFERLFREGIAKPQTISPHTDGVPLFDNDSIRRFLARTDQLSPQSFPGKTGPEDLPSSLTNEASVGDPLSTNDNLNGILTLTSRNASLEAQKLELQRVALSGIDSNAAVRAADLELGVLTMQQLALAGDDVEGQNQLGGKIRQAQQNRELALSLATESANRKSTIDTFALDQQIIQNNARILNLKALQGHVASQKPTIPGKMADSIMQGYNLTSRVEAELVARQHTPAQNTLWFESSSNPEGVYTSWADPNRMSDPDNYKEYVVNSAPPELQQQVRDHLDRLDVATKEVGRIAKERIEASVKENRGKGGQWEDPEFIKSQFLSQRQDLFDQMIAKSFHDSSINLPPGALRPERFDSQEEYQLARIIQDTMDPSSPNLETALNDVVSDLPAHIDLDLARGAVSNLIKQHRELFNETNRYSGSLMDIQTTRSLTQSIIGRMAINSADAGRMDAMKQLQQNALAIPVPGDSGSFQLPPTRSTLGVGIPHPRSAARFGLTEEELRGAGGGAGGGGGGGGATVRMPGDVSTFLKVFTTGVTQGAELAVLTAAETAAQATLRGARNLGTAIDAVGRTAGGIADDLGISPSAVRERERLEQEKRNRADSRGGPGIRG